jgi:general secretion pathway protein A
MYTAFYKLNERPFELTPDLRFLYLSPKHKEALAHLTYGVAERKVFVQLTGEVGTGKTLMLDALVHGLDATTKVARITNTTISRTDLLRALAWELGLPGAGRTKMEVLKEVSDCLSEWAAAGRNAVFVIDEAQNLESPLLEEIRLLSNLRSLGRSSLQIVLAGQPELRVKLESADLRQLRQRIGIRYHLEPLSLDEADEYVRHRLHVAGAKDDRIFDASAIDAVYEYSQGIPRMINIICDNSLLSGYADGKSWIGRRTVRETVESLETREPAHAASAGQDAGRG